MKKLLKFGKNNSLKYNFRKDLPKIMYKSFAKPFYNQHNIIMDTIQFEQDNKNAANMKGCEQYVRRIRFFHLIIMHSPKYDFFRGFQGVYFY